MRSVASEKKIRFTTKSFIKPILSPRNKSPLGNSHCPLHIPPIKEKETSTKIRALSPPPYSFAEIYAPKTIKTRKASVEPMLKKRIVIRNTVAKKPPPAFWQIYYEPYVKNEHLGKSYRKLAPIKEMINKCERQRFHKEGRSAANSPRHFGQRKSSEQGSQTTTRSNYIKQYF